MAFIALNTSATGLSALSTSLDVIANNLANVNTVGFKQSRVNFEDLLYIERAQPGGENALGQERPIGLSVGLGVQVSGTQLNFQEGPAQQTGMPLDLLIEGEGFFQVEIDPEIGDGIGYTRAGNFTLNSQGEIVLANAQGNRLHPDITVPEDALTVQVNTDGSVWITTTGSIDQQQIGTLEISRFINPSGLQQIGDTLFVPTSASGEPINGEPGQAGLGLIHQGFLEGSNVDPVVELVNLIRTQRAFELNSQAIQATNETLQNISNLARA
ncbi:MAG: flagellar basal-body rod protein FlgG [Phycisphaerales bacterium]|nr:flagellar basal-body rod protein FlgG [Phycisphaerales bacterium]